MDNIDLLDNFIHAEYSRNGNDRILNEDFIRQVENEFNVFIMEILEDYIRGSLTIFALDKSILDNNELN